MEFWESLDHDGHFLTISGHFFPTDRVVRPGTLKLMGCHAPFGSGMEYTSALMGIVRGQLFHSRVLKAMHECALNIECHYPPGDATFTNQRRDQSSLNAAICALQG